MHPFCGNTPAGQDLSSSSFSVIFRRETEEPGQDEYMKSYLRAYAILSGGRSNGKRVVTRTRSGANLSPMAPLAR